jgi:CHAT domain-containing protein/Tfp pilus assembly protein PilF
MKLIPTLLCSLFTLHFSLFTFHSSLSQDITTDTIMAIQYRAVGDSLYYEWDLAGSTEFYHKAADIYKTLALKTNDPVMHELYTRCLYDIAWNYKSEMDFKVCLNVLDTALAYALNHVGENHPVTATLYNGYGCMYDDKSEYDRALDYFYKSLEIRLKCFGEMHADVGDSYNNIGNIFNKKFETEKALDYFFKSLSIWMEIEGESNPDVAMSYNNIGMVYYNKSDFDKALEYFNKSLKIRLDFLGGDHPDVADSYNNIGMVYDSNLEYDKALEYYEKSLTIRLNAFGEGDYDVSQSYNNIAVLYSFKAEYDKALLLFLKSLNICKTLFGDKHIDVAMTYNNIGKLFYLQKNYDKALQYYHNGLISCISAYNDTINTDIIPPLNNYLEWPDLLDALIAKGEIFNCTQHPELALQHYQTADSLISKVRKEISSLSDKIALGEKANLLYKASAELCEQEGFKQVTTKGKRKYAELSFYFSERNKSSVLLEALAGLNAMKFAGIPESLLKKEQDLGIVVSNCITLKNNAENDSMSNIWAGRLFDANRSYDSLIRVFELNYPSYYKLKYNNSPVSMSDIQKIMDKKTAMLVYSVLDTSILIYEITKTRFELYNIPKIPDFEIKLIQIRSSMQNSSVPDVLQYKSLAFELYKQLFPKELSESKSFAKIENLIIIPDGNLASLPFETLMTEEYKTNWTDWKNTAFFSEMPFLLKKYAVSYSYSATLFQNTFPKLKADQIEITDLNDWLAFAPVFDNEGISGTGMLTRKLLSDINTVDFSDTRNKRSFLTDGTYISPLPGSLDEVTDIFNLFDQSGKKAVIYTHKKADEEFLKSNELKKYNILHFATHGFVNIQNPELSGILTAQDTSLNVDDFTDRYGYIAQQNDGIWYQSEIYNTKLNADLVVLSACETGLGKIASGEGVIGLTRALLYAGSKNIIVSLWQVSDESTKQLMVGFYKNLLNQKSKKKAGYSDHLQKAKLKLINEGTYAHPFFWSPFILIGK